MRRLQEAEPCPVVYNSALSRHGLFQQTSVSNTVNKNDSLIKVSKKTKK